MPDRPIQNGCGITNAIEMSATSVAFNNGFVATCPLAATYAIFEADVLQPVAMKHFGQAVARVDHWGTYACRNRNNRMAGPRSEHATGNAIDIAGFTLADGRKISVLDGWHGKSDERAFLQKSTWAPAVSSRASLTGSRCGAPRSLPSGHGSLALL